MAEAVVRTCELGWPALAARVASGGPRSRLVRGARAPLTRSADRVGSIVLEDAAGRVESVVDAALLAEVRHSHRAWGCVGASRERAALSLNERSRGGQVFYLAAPAPERGPTHQGRSSGAPRPGGSRTSRRSAGQSGPTRSARASACARRARPPCSHGFACASWRERSLCRPW